VREVTVFKDGHAYVLREAPLSAEGRGELVLEDLPVPVLGTFWPFATGGARLVSARAGRDTVAVDREAADLKQIVRANVARKVAITDVTNERITGELLGAPGDLLLVRTASGTRALPLTSVRDIEIQGEFAGKVSTEEQRERLTLRVDGGGDGAKVGVVYVQHGLRWIPSYRLDIDGEGKASVQMEATLVNDLIDLDAATVHLVVGVPKFAFEGLVDPISLQQEVAQIAARMQGAARMSNFLGNALGTQVPGYFVESPRGEQQPAAEVGDANEDLFVFTVHDVTLRKGERLVLPITAFDLTYRDVYSLTVPFTPPMEFQQGLQSEQALQLARELASPKAVHVLRLRNSSKVPLTTAPALVLAKGRVLAQGHVRYAPVGVETDVEINTAIDICVETDETEAQRADVQLGRNRYLRLDAVGSILLRNEKRETVEVEVRRRVLGLVDDVGQDGQKQQLDLVQVWDDAHRPGWWRWWNWPGWWFRWNGFGEFRWTVKLDPGESAHLEAKWHYFWQ
jgi:hypothetical protein